MSWILSHATPSLPLPDMGRAVTLSPLQAQVLAMEGMVIPRLVVVAVSMEVILQDVAIFLARKKKGKSMIKYRF